MPRHLSAPHHGIQYAHRIANPAILVINQQIIMVVNVRIATPPTLGKVPILITMDKQIANPAIQTLQQLVTAMVF